LLRGVRHPELLGGPGWPFRRSQRVWAGQLESQIAEFRPLGIFGHLRVSPCHPLATEWRAEKAIPREPQPEPAMDKWQLWPDSLAFDLKEQTREFVAIEANRG